MLQFQGELLIWTIWYWNMFILQSQGELLSWATFARLKEGCASAEQLTLCADLTRAHSFPKTSPCLVPKVHLESAVHAASPAHPADPAKHPAAPSSVKYGSSFLHNLASNQSTTKILFFICQVKTACIPRTKYSISTKANNLITETICLIFLSKHWDSSCTALAVSQVWRKEGGRFFLT